MPFETSYAACPRPGLSTTPGPHASSSSGEVRQMSEKKKGEEVPRRFEERLEEEAKRDAEAAKQFPTLAKAVIQGTAQTEDATVVTADGKKHRVQIRALGEGEIMDAMDQAGIDLGDLGNIKNFKANTKFQQIVCSKAIVGEAWSPEEIGKVLRFGVPAKLTLRILRLSGFFEPSAEAMDLFRPERTPVT